MDLVSELSFYKKGGSSKAFRGDPEGFWKDFLDVYQFGITFPVNMGDAMFISDRTAIEE